MGALRSFKAFTNAAPVSPTILIDALGTVTMTLARPCNLVNLDGYAAAAGWFQIFDSAVAPTSTVTVPLKSINIGAAGNLSSLLSSLGAISLNKGLFFAMSSTEAVYTAVATNFDVWGEVDEFEVQLSGTTVAGDLTTGVNFLDVWSEAAGPKKLYRVDIINQDGVALWAHIFARQHSNIVAADNPLLVFPLGSGASQLNFFLGTNGKDMMQQKAGTNYFGCCIILSTTGSPTTASVAGVSNIRAFYK